MEQKHEAFSYTYNAKQQEEIRKIRGKYEQTGEDKMELLRRLDRSVTDKSTIVALILGIVGTLIMGFGMSCVMVWHMFVPGIIVGVLGIAILSCAWPVYQHMTKKARERVAPMILKLTDELLQ